jgi:hypothetical protein
LWDYKTLTPKHWWEGDKKLFFKKLPKTMILHLFSRRLKKLCKITIVIFSFSGKKYQGRKKTFSFYLEKNTREGKTFCEK